MKTPLLAATLATLLAPLAALAQSPGTCRDGVCTPPARTNTYSNTRPAYRPSSAGTFDARVDHDRDSAAANDFGAHPDLAGVKNYRHLFDGLNGTDDRDRTGREYRRQRSDSRVRPAYRPESRNDYGRGDDGRDRTDPFADTRPVPTPAPTPRREEKVTHPAPSVADKVSYRYGNPVVGRFATATGWDTMVELYLETHRMIEARHLEPNTVGERVARSLENLAEGAGNAEFRRTHALRADRNAVDAYRSELSRLGARDVRTINDAVLKMRQAAAIGRRNLGLSEAATAAEFVYGAVDSLDQYSGFTPEDARRSGAAPSMTRSARHSEKTATWSDHDRTAGLFDESVVGLGVELKTHDRGVIVVKPLRGGPAERGGLERGDVITSIDGRSIAGRSLDFAADLITGPEGTPVLVGFERDGRGDTLTLRRARVELTSVSVVELFGETSRVGYIKLDKFADSTMREMNDALWDLHRRGMKSLVIDLRGNPGGLLTTAIALSDTFLPGGEIVSTRGKLAEDNSREVARVAKTWRVPLSVIVDEDSASASEIFAAAIQENGRGVIVGRRSYGKGTVQTHFPVRTVAGLLKLTTAKFYSPKGREMAGSGVTPDVTVEVDERIRPLLQDRDVRTALKVATGTIARDLAANAGQNVPRNSAELLTDAAVN